MSLYMNTVFLLDETKLLYALAGHVASNTSVDPGIPCPPKIQSSEKDTATVG